MSTLAPVSTDRFSLAGRKCLVTGGTKGIGKAIVEEFCKLQAEVCMHCTCASPGVPLFSWYQLVGFQTRASQVLCSHA